MIGAVFLLGFSDMVIDLSTTDFLQISFVIRVIVSSHTQYKIVVVIVV